MQSLQNADTLSFKSVPLVWIVTLSIARPQPSTTTRHKSVNAALNTRDLWVAASAAT
jgi:hypothetical protein